MAPARKRTLDPVKLVHANAPFERAADRCDFGISTLPLFAQRQQQNVAKLKADARNLVGIIGSDKTKTQTYCQIHDLSEQLIQAVQEKDKKKANALAEKIAELYKKMGPEFAALIDIGKHVDLNSPDGQEIASIVATLGESCGGQ
jgi:carboxylesterase type B